MLYYHQKYDREKGEFMLKKYQNLFAGLLALSLAFPGGVEAASVENTAPVSNNVERISGTNRTKTAIEISQKAFADDSVDSVVLIGYHGEVDALAGTLLAADKDAPVLISGSKELTADVKAEIDRLGAKNVYILGGEATVHSKIEKELKALKLNVERISGTNRAATAANVAKAVKGKTADKIFLASGEEGHLADGLAIAPVSAKEKAPVLLTDNAKKLSKETIDMITALNVKEIEFVGGEAVISDSIKNQFTTIEFDRVAGAGRVETALEIASKYFTESSQAIISYGWGSADALAGAYFAAKEDAPMLLSNTEEITTEALNYLDKHTDFAYVLGGSAVISESVLNKIADILGVDPSDLTLTILGTTDIHGQIYNWSYEDNKETNDRGMAKVKTVIDDVRAENPNTILLDAGDLIQGTILTDEIYSPNTDVINPMIDIYNYIGYDALALGNHEFNFGMKVVDNLIKDAEFPILSANIYNKADGTVYAEPYTIIEKGGLKIGVLGLSTPNIPRWDGDKVKDLEFKGMNEGAALHMEALKAEGVDLIVTAAHAGLGREYIEGDDMRTVIEENPEIDVALVGHTHASVTETVGTTIVGGARSEGREVIRFDIDMKDGNDGWEVVDKRVELINVANYKASEDLKEYAKEYHENTLKYIAQVIGEATGDFVPKQEIKGIPEAQIRDTAVMDLINQVQLEASGADVSAAALFSSTSNIEKGTITYADIFDIYKFPNTLVKVNITGQELVNYMEWSVKYYNTAKDGDVTVSFNPNVRSYLYDMFAGVDYKIDLSKEVGNRITDLTLKGKEVKADDTLTLVVNDYRYSGLKNDGVISGQPIYESAPTSSRELIHAFIDKHKVINPDEILDNNWEIIGVDLNHPLRDYIVGEVNNGNIELPKSEDGRTPNVKSLNVYELIKDGKIPTKVLEEHGLDAQGNKK